MSGDRQARWHGGVICAPTTLAAEAGASLLRSGGNAVDAAVATAFASAVTDPQNCGLGGFGGHAVVYDSVGRLGTALDFRSVVPQRWLAGERGDGPGALVAPPNVLSGLIVLHESQGCLTREAVMAPAIRLAHEGFPVGKDLAVALQARFAELPTRLQALFGRDGRPLSADEILAQPELAATLSTLSATPASWADVESSVIETVTHHGGFLQLEDFERLQQDVAPAADLELQGAHVYAATPHQSGAGVVLDALRLLEGAGGARLRSRRDVLAALWEAWALRSELSPVATSADVSGTTHLSVADAEGQVVSLTFTHGLHWFGAGLLAGDTGVLLNAGAPSFGRDVAGEPVFVTNMAPLVCHDDSRGVTVLGSPGGQRIPSIVLSVLLKVLDGESPEAALRAPRLVAAPEGGLEGEETTAPWSLQDGQTYRTVTPSVFYGPASCIRADRSGLVEAATDPRFSSAAIAEVPLT